MSTASPETRSSTALIAACLFALYVIWGSTYLAMRLALESLPPFFMAGVRFLTAGLVLFAVLRWRGVPMPTAREWRASAIVGLLLLTGGNGAVAFAQQWASSGLAAVVVATMPLWAALFSLLFGQRPSRMDWLGLVIGFLGVIWLSFDGAFNVRGLAAVVLLLAPVSWALGSIWGRQLPLPKGPITSALQMITGGAAMLVLSVMLGEEIPADISLRSGLAWVYLVLFGSLVGFSAYGYLLRHTRPAVATSYAYVNPIVAVWLGVTFADEPFTSALVVATLLILAGVAVVSLARQSRRPVSPAPATARPGT